MKDKTTWEIIREAVKSELAEIEKIKDISYDINTNGVTFYNDEREYSPKELLDIAEKAKNVRSKILGLVETGKVNVKDL